MKKCTKCGQCKPLEDFHKCCTYKDGVQTQCKKCRSLYAQNSDRKKRWYEGRKLQIITKQKERYSTNKVEIIQYKKEYYRKHQETLRLKSRTQSKKYKASSAGKEKMKEWRQKNKHILAWRGLLRSALKRTGQSKHLTTEILLGYSADKLKLHIENLWLPGMTWSNYGHWHIDHIMPVSVFPSDTDTKTVNALSNLRPLWATNREINGVVLQGNLNKGVGH